MPASLPFSLAVAWVLFSGFVDTHRRHAASIRAGVLFNHLRALLLSHLLGCIVGVGLLIYYFLHVAWYWPIILAALGSLIGGLLFGLIEVLGGRLLSLLAFVGWPSMAVWTFMIIRGLTP
jgi:hypothetical protein